MARKDMHDAPLEERVAIEARLWDRVRDETFADKTMLNLSYPTYETFFTSQAEYRWVHEWFGPSVKGKRVLEVGCGSGVVTVALANSGAHVTALDVSASGLRVTRERAAHYRVADRVETIQGAAERLELPEASIDLFFAKSVVHHLIIDDVMSRVYRFLKPGGRGAILEPQSNPILDFAREHLPYPGKVADEHGTDEFFTPAMIAQILGHFDVGEHKAFRLVSMLQKFVPGRGPGFASRQRHEARQRRFRAVAEPLDDFLFKTVPPIARLAQYVGLRFAKKA